MTGSDPRLQPSRPCFNFDTDSERQRGHIDGETGMAALVPANEFLLPWVEMKSSPICPADAAFGTGQELPHERSALAEARPKVSAG